MFESPLFFWVNKCKNLLFHLFASALYQCLCVLTF